MLIVVVAVAMLGDITKGVTVNGHRGLKVDGAEITAPVDDSLEFTVMVGDHQRK